MCRIALLVSLAAFSPGCIPSPLGQPTGQGDASPSVADFEVLSYQPRWEDGLLRVTGEVRNNGEHAAGVELELVARDQDGTAIDTHVFFPAGSENIPPGGARAFTRALTEDQRATSATIQLVGVFVW
jgi:hypothetical protein